MTRRALLPAGTLLVTAVLLAGCAGQGAQTASAAGSASSSAAEESTAATGGSAATSPVGDDSDGDSNSDGDSDGDGDGDDGGGGAPAFSADIQPDTAEASSDARVTVTDIRTGRHDGFDRVVFEVDGTGTPGWDVRYVDTAWSQGSGEPVDVAGDAVLQVTVTGAGYPYDTGVEEYAGPDPLPGQGTATVTEVAFDATFEGTTVAFVGTRAQAPFRVYPLEDPSRIVVEVADPD
ncbi:hypothetical protein JOD57_002047 [Geodermatophilus bullaregiensis]|uniref:AMIN-like domain-containing (lipo)protein n=1 Tax=Geodermatophilus bullaregiensis TaxID=1564160 RepID=UPI001958A21D|nr:hypothetical protein [Geodermatophilus bullaregiensis]MBM7806210.1 hypothetical protein [Geodermatophilus bullaregiensis]